MKNVQLRRKKITIKNILKIFFYKILKINNLYKEGHKIIYWTARGGHSGIDWSMFTKRQIDNCGCQYTRIEKRKKPSYDLFICDKTKRIEEI